MMVLPDDAKLFYPREKLLAVNENHSQIAKVKRGEGGIYPNIRSAIKRALFGAAGTPAITQVLAGTMQDVNASSKTGKASYSRKEIDRVEKVFKPT